MKGEETAKTFSAETLCKLANKFLKQEMFDEAIELLEESCQLYPENLTLKIQLGRTRDALRSAQNSSQLSSKATAIREQRDLRANLLYGLIDLHIKRLEQSKAIGLLKEAIKLNPYHFYPYSVLGRLAYQERDYNSALNLLSRAKAINPFHEDTCYYLALTYFYLERHQEALGTMIDALILSGDLEKQQTSPYQQKIQLIMEKFPGFDRNMRNQLVKERQQKFKQLYDQSQRDIHNQHIPLTEPATATLPPEAAEVQLSEEQLRIIAKLKSFFILKHLDDRVITLLATFTKELTIAEKATVYKENTPIRGLFLIEKGDVNIVKETPLGNLDLVHFTEGRFFGDEDLLYGNNYTTTAVVSSANASLLEIDRASLLNLFAEDMQIALHFYWYFWKSLAFQIRQANEQLKSFFANPRKDKKSVKKSDKPGKDDKKNVHYELAVNQKEKLLKDKGIDTDELKLIAQLCTEEFYNAGEFVFRENDPGEKLYIIAAGEVLISKKIDGVGDEALAILGKGEFFGEMALIDGEARSADAKAHKSGTTVLAIKRDVLKEILNMDAKSSCKFLTVLYRMLNNRLQEIREKIYQWKIMAGGF